MPTKKKFDGSRSAREGEAILLAPDHVTALAVGGIEYVVEPDGSITIPREFAADAVAHGFRLHTA